MTQQETDRPTTDQPTKPPAAPRELVRAWFPRLGERLDEPTPGDVFDRQIDDLARQARDLAAQINQSCPPQADTPPRDGKGETA